MPIWSGLALRNASGRDLGNVSMSTAAASTSNLRLNVSPLLTSRTTSCRRASSSFSVNAVLRPFLRGFRRARSLSYAVDLGMMFASAALRIDMPASMASI